MYFVFRSDINLYISSDLISRADNKPMVAVAVDKLESIQQPVELLSSHLVAPEDRKHYGLCVGPYTSFIHPLQRYLSIVVQRMLIGELMICC